MRKALLRGSVMLATLVPSALLASDTNQCDGLIAAGGKCDANQLPNAINNSVINTLFTVAGAIAVIIIIIGGIRYITSTGDSARIKSAKDTILYAVIGLVIVIIARAIVGFVAGSFT